MDVRTEIDDLKRRVGELEGAVNVLSGRISQVHPELLLVKRQSSEGFDRMGVAFDRMINRLDTINSQVWALRDDLPVIVGTILARDSRPPGEGQS